MTRPDSTNADPHPSSSMAGYGNEADALAVQYESITFAQAHQASLHLS